MNRPIQIIRIIFAFFPGCFIFPSLSLSPKADIAGQNKSQTHSLLCKENDLFLIM